MRAENRHYTAKYKKKKPPNKTSMELDEQDRETKWYEIIIAIILISPVALFLWVRDKLTTKKISKP